jgi:glycosyltransferase involved in cell wall biosynthesis
MPDTRKISVCIPVFNRYELLLQSYNCVLDDDRVDEIIIVDDASDRDIFDKVCEAVQDEPKIRLFRNEENIDCYRNKQKAVSLASNPFCVLLDSDNIIDRDYLDKLYEFDEWESGMIYAPDYARPISITPNFRGLS